MFWFSEVFSEKSSFLSSGLFIKDKSKDVRILILHLRNWQGEYLLPFLLEGSTFHLLDNNYFLIG